MENLILRQRFSDKQSGSIISHLNIGRSELLGGYFKGVLDDVAIFDRALTQEEIKSIWINRLSGEESGLEIYYDF